MQRNRKDRGYSLATVRMIRKSLKEIRRKKGAVTARSVVDYARPRTSPLHRFFEWKDSVAAERYRLSQAVDMLARLHVTVQYQGKPINVRVVLGVEEAGERRYKDTSEVFSKPDFASQVLAEMRADLEAMQRRYEVYSFIFAKKLVTKIREAIAALDQE